MKCGHVIDTKDKSCWSDLPVMPDIEFKNWEEIYKSKHKHDKRPKSFICPRCRESIFIFKIKNNYTNLEGRYAICGEKKVRSRWDLPGFIYRPKEEYDIYFYGVEKRTTKSKEIHCRKDEFKK